MGLREVEIYTDGSALGNPGPGGWAALLRYRDGKGRVHEKLLQGGEPHTTNNRMELKALLEALKALKASCRVHVWTDSHYLKKAFTGGWLEKWTKKGWKNARGENVKNRDLWEALLEAAKEHELVWHWVEGHAGHPENERVDRAARAQARRFATAFSQETEKRYT